MPEILPEGEEMLSLIAVAKQQSTNVFDRLLKAGAETSSWTSNEGFDIEYPNLLGLQSQGL